MDGQSALVRIVADYSDDPPQDVRYEIGDFVFVFEDIYLDVKKVQIHPGKGHYSWRADTQDYLFQHCSEEYVELYFSCLDIMVKYFTHCAKHDNAVVRGVWCRMLDQLILQSATLPHEDRGILNSLCPHSQRFEMQLNTSIDAINRALVGNRQTQIAERVVSTIGSGTPDQVDSAIPGMKSGLTRWEQYLYNDSPGFGVGGTDLHYSAPQQNLQAPLTIMNPTQVQHLPCAAVHIIMANSDQLTDAANDLAAKNEDERDEILQEDEAEIQEILAPFTYTNIHGETVNAHHMTPRKESDAAPPNPLSSMTDIWDLADHITYPTTSEIEQVVGELEDAYVPTHPLGDDEFNMLTLITDGNNPHSAEYDLSKVFTDWEL